jgi:hypothetical protein
MAISFPKVKSGKELPACGRFRGQSRRLAAHIRLPEQDGPYVAVLNAGIDLEKFSFGGNPTDDDGIGLVVLGELACFVSGVDGLDDLLREGDIRADEDVEVGGNLGHMSSFHAHYTTGHPVCQVFTASVELPWEAGRMPE